MIVTRFAPSPTGHLHLGHAYAALRAYQAARRENGVFLLRIEDIDPARCRPQFSADLIEDLRWLGLDWPEPPRRQSEHSADYRAALAGLQAQGLIYPCFCTRQDIAAAGHAPHLQAGGPDGPVYPGTCRVLSAAERADRIAAGHAFALRLDMARAALLAGPLDWHDRKRGTLAARPEPFGDVVLARKDVPTSYHLSVTVDDHLQGVTLVTRGEDLLAATHIHRLLQALLGYPPPEYAHHPLLTDAAGRRYAKRDRAVTLRALRAAGKTAEDVRAMAAA